MMGRPKLDVDLDEIRELAAEGNTQEDIAKVLGFDRTTFGNRPDMKEAYELGMSDLRLSLRHWQVQSAKGGNTTMLIWLGKILLGQREEVNETITLTKESDALTKSLQGLADEMDAKHAQETADDKREATEDTGV